MNTKSYKQTIVARKSNSEDTAELDIHLTFQQPAYTTQVLLYISFDDTNKLREFYGNFYNGLTYVCMFNNEEIRISQAYGGFDWELRGVPFESVDQNTIRVKYCIRPGE